MNRFIIFSIIGIFFIFPARAQESDSAMKNAVCKLLALQNQNSNSNTIGNSVAYQEGVDSYGRAVVPATGQKNNQSQSLFIPIEVDLAQKFNIPEIKNLDETQIGTAEIKPDGQVLFGNNDITTKMNEWCGTPVAKENIVQLPIIDPPRIDKPILPDAPAPIIPPIIKADGTFVTEDETPKEILNEDILYEVEQMNGEVVLDPLSKSEVQGLAVSNSDAIEILPTKAIPPLEIKPNTGSNDAEINTQSDIITGTDFRGYNE